MRRLEILIVLGFAIMFAAGLAVGRSKVVASLTAPAKPDKPEKIAKPEERTPTLGLTSEQRQKWDAIWKEARASAEQSRQAIADADDERDIEIYELLTPVQADVYELIQDVHDDNVDRHRTAIRTKMEEANKKLRALLTPEQSKKFDQMDRMRRRGPGSHGPGTHGPGSHGPGSFGHGADTRYSRPQTAPRQ